MTDHLGKTELDDLGKPPKGSGEVVEWKSKVIVACKDDGVKIFSCPAKCTHMGCIVYWNGAKNS
jgi:Rieske Fe-S protein